jgi:hypothetical protein
MHFPVPLLVQIPVITMGLFNLLSDWKHKLLDEPLDRKMLETMRVGVAVARAEVHVITGKLHDSIYGEYDRSRKVVMLHADKPYALIEETRGPTRHHSDHHYLAPAAEAMGKVWGGNFELHFPNAAIGRAGYEGLRNRERKLYHRLNGMAKRTNVHARRWHKRHPDSPLDPIDPTPLIL